MEYLVFRALSAAFHSYKSDTSCEIVVFVDDYSGAHKRPRTTLDMSLALGAATWATIKFDARGIQPDGSPLPPYDSPASVNGVGITTLGPLPQLPGGQYLGAVYVTEAHWAALAASKHFDDKLWTSVCAPSFVYQTIAYSDAAANGGYRGRRYAGFLATVEANQGGGILSVTIDQGPNAPSGPWRIDLNDPGHVAKHNPVGAGEFVLTGASQKGDSGALYIELHHAAELQMIGPKLPIGMGY